MDTRTCYWSWLYWYGHENILVLAVLAWMQEHIFGLGCIGMDARTCYWSCLYWHGHKNILLSWLYWHGFKNIIIIGLGCTGACTRTYYWSWLYWHRHNILSWLYWHAHKNILSWQYWHGHENIFAGVTVLAWAQEHIIGLGCIGTDTRTCWSRLYWHRHKNMLSRLYWHGHKNIILLSVLAVLAQTRAKSK